jgi:hypothetical protein
MTAGTARLGEPISVRHIQSPMHRFIVEYSEGGKRIHPELGGIVGVIATLIGLQPKDVMVWVLEGKEPEVVRIVGQLGGYRPVVNSELEGTSFRK